MLRRRSPLPVVLAVAVAVADEVEVEVEVEIEAEVEAGGDSCTRSRSSSVTHAASMYTSTCQGWQRRGARQKRLAFDVGLPHGTLGVARGILQREGGA